MTVKVTVRHNLGQKTALTRIKGRISELLDQYPDVKNTKVNWVEYVGEFSGTYKGFSVTGTLRVTESSVTVEADLPFVLRPFKSRIEEAIREELKELLS